MTRRLLPLALLLVLTACGEDPAPTPRPDGPGPEAASLAPGPSEAPGSTAATEEPALTGSPDGDAVGMNALAPLPEPAVAGVKAVPDTMEAFHARMEQLLAACRDADTAKGEADARELLLPDPRAWFAHAFGKDHPQLDALVKDYEDTAALVPTLPRDIRHQFAIGETQLLAERFIDPDDELATGFQAVALDAATRPIALYSLRLLKPEAEKGWHLWSFAHVDGRFRFVGHMLPLSPDSADPDLRQLGSRRVKHAKAFLAEQAPK